MSIVFYRTLNTIPDVNVRLQLLTDLMEHYVEIVHGLNNLEAINPLRVDMILKIDVVHIWYRANLELKMRLDGNVEAIHQPCVCVICRDFSGEFSPPIPALVSPTPSEEPQTRPSTPVEFGPQGPEGIRPEHYDLYQIFVNANERDAIFQWHPETQ